MKRRIAVLLVICMLTSMAPAATAGDTVADVIPGEGIEIVDGGDQDLSEPLVSDGIEVEADGLPDETFNYNKTEPEKYDRAMKQYEHETSVVRKMQQTGRAYQYYTF